MRLVRFRIRDFRAIKDTGDVNCGAVTVFAGDNESGKTTLFYALLKLMDLSKDTTAFLKAHHDIRSISKIDKTLDLPLDRPELMVGADKLDFIEAGFEADDDVVAKLKKINPKFVAPKIINVTKNYGGKYGIDILSAFGSEAREQAEQVVIGAIPKFMFYQEVTEVEGFIDFVTLALKLKGLLADNKFTEQEATFLRLLKCLDIWENTLVRSIEDSLQTELTSANASKIDFDKVLRDVPLFAKRIQNGFGRLNEQFLDCWGRDDSKISFRTYKRGLKIVIIDRESNTEYSLENRSTGFRRFFAHFLTFSITALSGIDRGSILLFDEAGAAMHSVTQRKLAEYFVKIGGFTQILYNTHSSYMIPVKHLNNVKVVYKDATRHTTVTEKLILSRDKTNELSLFPVQSALGLYAGEKLLGGCLPIMVLNDEDEAYLSLTRSILTSKGKFKTVYQTLIVSTGINGLSGTADMFADNSDLPAALIPNDTDGEYDKLISAKYAQSKHKVAVLSQFLKGATEFEDLIPVSFIDMSSRLYLRAILGDGFTFNPSGKTLKAQVEDYAAQKRIVLPLNWRYEVAKRVKLNIMSYFGKVFIPAKYIRAWDKMWKVLIALSE
jgi:hypothetical protein